MLEIQQLHYQLYAPDPLDLNMDLPTATLRGALGYALARVLAEDATLVAHEECLQVYCELFALESADSTRSRNHDPARCYVVRGGFLTPDRRNFGLELLLFGEAVKFEPLMDKAVDSLACAGVGRQHARCEVRKVDSRTIDPHFPATNQIIVDFATPTRIKADQRWWNHEIPFHAVIARLADRVNDLTAFYGEPAAPLLDREETREIIRRARDIYNEKLSGGRYNGRRISTKTGDESRLDGFIGRMFYSGDLAPFADLLKYLPWVHVGKSSVFGCGWTTIECLNCG